MGFDAGKITAHMELGTDGFNASADDVKSEKEELAQPVEIPVGLNDDELDADAEKIEETKAALSEPVDIDVNLNGEEAVAEAEATGEGVKEALGEDPTVTPELDGAPMVAEAEATGLASRAALNDAFLGAGDKGPLLAGLFDAGANSPTLLASALESLQWKPADARALVQSLDQQIFGALPPGAAADGLAAAMLPSQADFTRDITSGIKKLGSGTYEAPVLDVLAGIGTATTAEDGRPIYEQLGLPPLGEGFHNITGDASGSSYADAVADAGFTLDGGEIKSAAQEFADKWKAATASDLIDGQYAVFQAAQSSYGDSPWKALFKGTSGVADDLKKWADKAGVDVGDNFVKGMSKGVTDAAKDATSFGGGGGFIGSITGALSSGAQSFVGGAGKLFSSVGDLSGGAQAGILAAPLVVPILGAVGLATGGAVAGTAIGTAGLLTALVPGVMDLVKGYTAYSDAKSGTADPGATAGNVAVGNAIGNIVSGGSSFLGKAEAVINPSILKFLDALNVGLGTFEPFAQAAIGSLGRFFDVIDAGLQSGGFKSFIATMSKDVGPIMDDFGKFMENMGTAFGGFLKLFGGAPAQAVGAWFDRVSKGLSSFLNNATISPGFMAGMIQSFNFLGAALDAIWRVLTKVFEALAPIGLTMMKVLTPAFQGLGQFINDIPVNVLTGIALGIGAIVIAGSPMLLWAAAILAAVAAFKVLSDVIADEKNGYLKPMSAADITNAFAGELTPAGKLTPAETQAVAHAKALGLTPQQIGSAYTAIAPHGPNVFGGGGWTSNIDGVRLGPGGKVTPAPVSQGLRAAQDPTGIRWKVALADTAGQLQAFVKNIGNWAVDVAHWAQVGWEKFDANFIHPIAHFFDSTFPDFFTEGAKYIGGWAGDVGHWATTGWQKFDNNFVHPIANFFSDRSKMNGFIDDIGNWAGDVGHWATDAWQGFDSGFVHPIATFFTTTIPHEFDVVISFFQSFPGRIVSAIGNGLTVLSGWGKDLVHGIANGITSAAGAIGSALKHIADGIPGFSQMKSFLSGMPGLGFLSGWAAGGPFQGNGPMLVGELGPEILVPGATGMGGYVIPNNRLTTNGFGSRNGGMSITISVDARGSGNPSGVQQAAQSGITAVLPQLRRAVQRSAA